MVAREECTSLFISLIRTLMKRGREAQDACMKESNDFIARMSQGDKCNKAAIVFGIETSAVCTIRSALERKFFGKIDNHSYNLPSNICDRIQTEEKDSVMKASESWIPDLIERAGERYRKRASELENKKKLLNSKGWKCDEEVKNAHIFLQLEKLNATSELQDTLEVFIKAISDEYDKNPPLTIDHHIESGDLYN